MDAHGAIGALAEPFLRPMEEPAAARLARRRLRLIAAAPALLNHPTLRELEVIVASLFDQKFEPPALMARTVIAVAFGAMFWWAEQGDGVTALEALSMALRGVAGGSLALDREATSGRGPRALANARTRSSLASR